MGISSVTAGASKDEMYQWGLRIMATDRAALSKLKDELERHDKALESIVASIKLPESYGSEARRIANELRSNLIYRRDQEIPALVDRFAPPEEQAAEVPAA